MKARCGITGEPLPYRLDMVPSRCDVCGTAALSDKTKFCEECGALLPYQEFEGVDVDTKIAEDPDVQRLRDELAAAEQAATKRAEPTLAAERAEHLRQEAEHRRRQRLHQLHRAQQETEAEIRDVKARVAELQTELESRQTHLNAITKQIDETQKGTGLLPAPYQSQQPFVLALQRFVAREWS